MNEKNYTAAQAEGRKRALQFGSRIAAAAAESARRAKDDETKRLSLLGYSAQEIAAQLRVEQMAEQESRGFGVRHRSCRVSRPAMGGRGMLIH